MRAMIGLAVLLVSAPALADLYLEAQTVQAGKEKPSLTEKVFLTRTAARIERSDGLTAIFRTDRKVLIQWRSDAKAYDETPCEAFGEAMASARKEYADGLDSLVKQIKEMESQGVPKEVLEEANKNRARMEIHVEDLAEEKVAGHPCRHVRVTQEDMAPTELWTPRDIKDSDDLSQFNLCRGNMEGWGSQLWLKVQGIPFRVTVLGEDGKAEFKAEVTKAEVKDLPPTLFEPPKDYVKHSQDSPPPKEGQDDK